MSKITINKVEKEIIPSILLTRSETEDGCSSTIQYGILLQSGQSKYINIINSGNGAEFIGNKGLIEKSTNVTLIVNGDNTGDLNYSGIITLIIRDKKNGTIEHIVSLKREHNNTFCSGGTT